MLIVKDLSDFDLIACLDIKHNYGTVLGAHNHKLGVGRDAQFGPCDAVRSRVDLLLKASRVEWLPCADVPNFYDMILATRNDIPLIRGEARTGDLIEMGVLDRMDTLSLPIAYIPELHVFHMCADHDSF